MTVGYSSTVCASQRYMRHQILQYSTVISTVTVPAMAAFWEAGTRGLHSDWRYSVSHQCPSGIWIIKTSCWHLETNHCNYGVLFFPSVHHAKQCLASEPPLPHLEVSLILSLFQLVKLYKIREQMSGQTKALSFSDPPLLSSVSL